MEKMMEWQPIETAPSRENILLYWPNWYDEPIIGFHDSYGWHAFRPMVWDGVSPTHWMPLPEAPNDQHNWPQKAANGD